MILQLVKFYQHHVHETKMAKGTRKLTNKLWCPKYVLEFISKVNFMGQAKVDNLDPRFRDISIQKHYVLRL